MRTRRQLISLLLMLALLLGMIPGVAVSALAEELEIEGDLPEDTGEGMLTDLDLGQIETAPALRTGAAPTATGTAEPFLTSEEGNEPVEKDVSKLNGSNWMSGIRGDAYLNDFNIPYTHDAAMKDYIYHWGTQSSGNFFGQGSYAKTQYLYIPQQLEAGVRILDLRLNNRYEAGYWGLTGKYYVQTDDYYHLYLCHGKNPSGGTFWAEDSDGEYVTFERVCKYVRDFLTEHPTETVILDLNIETQDNDKYGDDVASSAAWWLRQMFYREDTEVTELSPNGYTTIGYWDENYLINPSTGKPYIYTEPGNTSWRQPYTHMPQLKDCRGQVVVMYQAHQFEGVIGGMKRDIAGEVKILGGSNSASDSNKYEALVNDYVEGGPNDLMLPMPGEHRNLLRIVDTNSHANEFWDYVLVAIDDMHPLAIADYVHPKVFGDGKLLSIVGKYYGWVKMDGATEQDCRYIWKTNFPDNYVKGSTVTVSAGDASVDLGDNQYYAAHFANYEDQVYEDLVTGSFITIPGNIYDVQKYSSGLHLDYWEITDAEGNPVKDAEGNPVTKKPGETFQLPAGNTTFTPVYRDLGLQTFIQVNWQDSDNADGLRPGKLDVICTYLDENKEEKETTITVTSSPRQAYDQYYRRNWVADFIGDLKSIRPSWVRIPTDESKLGQDTDEFYRYDEITGEPGGTMVINLVHTSPKTRTLESVVTWDDHDDADHLRPDSVTLHLYQEDADGNFKPIGDPHTVEPERTETTETVTVDGEEVTTTVVTEVWKTEFPDCQAYRNGRAIRYQVLEDPISEYYPRYKGMSIENYHEAKHTVKRAVVKWVDSDDVANIRPKSAALKLMAREKGSDAPFEQVSEFEFYEYFSWYMADIEFWGPEYTDDALEYTVEPYEVEGYNVSWVEKMEIDLPYYELTYTLIPETKPAALDGTYKSGYTAEDDNGQMVSESGEKISFERGTYITDDVMDEPALMVGEQELTWIKYDEGKHHFTIGEQQIALWDTDHNRPWGIKVSGGKGTQEEPYTFTVLHDEAINYYVGAYDDALGLVKFTKKTRSSDYTVLTSDITTLEGGKWYVFDGETVVVHGSAGNPDITYNSGQLHFDDRVTVTGTVNLILRNNEQGKHLIFEKGIEFAPGATLNIYQERLNRHNASVWAYGRDGNAGIDLSAGGALILHGGIVHADTYSDGYAAIGGKADGQGGGSLTVYGNWVYAEVVGSPRASAPSIGPGVDVTVYGGGVNAEGNGYNAIVGGKITVGEGIAVYKDHFDRGDDPDEDYLSERDGDDYVRTSDMTIREGHLHEFTYSSEGDTITATCSKESCNHQSFTLTLVKPEKTKYLDGLSAEATLKDGWNDFARATHLNITIQYYLREGSKDTVLDAAPEKAGDYKAVVNLPVDNAIATVYYTIDKAKVEITAPTASAITYGQTLADSTWTVEGVAKVGETVVEGIFAWANPRIQPAVSDSETTEYTVNFTPTGDDADNYEPATCKVTLVVNTAGQNVKAPEALDPTYNGEEQALVSKGTADHGVMKYALGNTAPDAAAEDKWEYNVPAATDAGDYKVWYKVFSGDDNYGDTEPAFVLAKIEKADASGTVMGRGLVYNGSPQKLLLPGEPVGGTLQYFLGDAAPTDEADWSKDIPTGTAAGDYKVWYRVKGDGNHNDTKAALVVVTIDKVVVKVSKPPVASAITYGQTLANSTLSGGDWLPKVDGHFEWKAKTTAPAVSDSATTQYEVTFVPKDSDNYEAGADKFYATVVVIPADPTVTPPTVNSPLLYTGEAQALVKAGSATNGTMKYALGKTAPASKDGWSATVPTGTETGDYIVWYKVFGAENYNGTEAAPLYVTIYPAQSGDVKPDTLVYNGEEQKLVVPGTVVGGTLQYFVGDDAPTDASQWKNDIPTGTDAGDYKVWYRVKGDANHNDGKPGSVTATIAKAPITPGVSITGWTYGEAANEPAVTGNPGNGEVTVAYSAEKKGAYTTAVPTQAGSWFVKAEVAETKNYQAGTAYPVSFAIAKVNVSIFADNKSGIYGDALQTLTWRLGGKTVNSDDLGVTLTATAKADSAPGDYPITVKWNGNKNYSATVVDGVYTVGKRPVTVAAADQTVREGEQIATGVDHATASGLVEGHVLSAVTLAADGSAIKASGAKIVDAAGADVTANYAVSYAAGKLNVQQPGTPVVFPPTAKELTYNGKAQALVTAGKAEGGTMQYSADNKTWSEKLPTGTDAGEYTVWYRVKGDADHGDVAASSLKVTIAKASIAPVVTITGWTYGEEANKPAVTGNSGNGEVTVTYSAEKEGAYTTAVPTQAGSWFVKAEVAATKNYESGIADPVGFAIAKVSVSIFADNKSGVYGDALQTLTWRFGEKTVNGDDLGISLTTTAKAGSAPGDYPITVKWSGNANYSAIVKDGVYTVGKRPVTVAAGDQTIQSGGKIATGVDHATATGLAEGHKLSAVTLAASGSAIKASGAKIVDAKGTDVTANYAVSYAAGKLNVLEPGTPAVFPPAAKELTYNGKAQALVSAGKAEGGTMQYSADNKTWSENIPTGTDTGEYTVWYRVKGDADHGDVAASSLKVTIAKAAPKVTAPTAEKLTYNGNAQALVSAGEVEGGKLLYSKDNKTWSEEIPTGTKAGRYTVYYKVEGDKNHSDAAAKRVKVTIAERKASPDYTLMARMTTSGSTRLKLSWSKVKGAQGYDVFFKNCDGKQNYTRVTITSERSYTITGLKKRKAYKAYVVAWKKSGDRKYYIGDASPIVHAITGGYTSKQCNAKSVELSKSSLTLKVGKSETLKTSVKGVKSGRKVLQHARLVRYYSSDANVAKVNKNGKITAVGKGSCTVYAVANNGVRSKVTVKVN